MSSRRMNTAFTMNTRSRSMGLLSHALCGAVPCSRPPTRRNHCQDYRLRHGDRKRTPNGTFASVVRRRSHRRHPRCTCSRCSGMHAARSFALKIHPGAYDPSIPDRHRRTIVRICMWCPPALKTQSNFSHNQGYMYTVDKPWGWSEGDNCISQCVLSARTTPHKPKSTLSCARSVHFEA